MNADDVTRQNCDELSREREATPSAAPADKAPRPDQTPAAGPHAAPDLSNPEATPGAGTLQAPGAQDDMDSTG